MKNLREWARRCGYILRKHKNGTYTLYDCIVQVRRKHGAYTTPKAYCFSSDTDVCQFLEKRKGRL